MPPPYYQQPVNQQMMSSTVVVQNNSAPPKSVGTAVVLAILFGPLGMLYSTILGAVVMFFINLILVFLTAGLGLFLSFPAGAVWAAVAAQNHNRSNTLIATNNNMR